MYAADHEALFGAAVGKAARASTGSADLSYDALLALGRRERSRQFARLFDRAAAGLKRRFRRKRLGA